VLALWLIKSTDACASLTGGAGGGGDVPALAIQTRAIRFGRQARSLFLALGVSGVGAARSGFVEPLATVAVVDPFPVSSSAA
jgi:hypothetical protein